MKLFFKIFIESLLVSGLIVNLFLLGMSIYYQGWFFMGLTTFNIITVVVIYCGYKHFNDKE